MSTRSNFLIDDDAPQPCYGSYSPRHPDCRECADEMDCRSETANSGQALGRYSLPNRSSPTITQKATTTAPTQDGPLAVSHGNFSPYAGETMGVRLAKNLLLNILTGAAATIMRFLEGFHWKPKEKQDDQG